MPGKESQKNKRIAAYAGLLLLSGCVIGGCKEPGATGEITELPVPTVTASPQPTYTNTIKPTVTDSPATPTDTPTESPTATPTVSPTTEPTLSQSPTVAPTVSPTPKPTVRVTPTPTVKPTEAVDPTPEPTVEATVTPTEEPTFTPTPMPEPTAVPEYDTLIQNGWQRTEDFFGKREVYFSGMFDTVDLIAEEGRYGYRYLATADADISLSIIGEESLTVQAFTGELKDRYPECSIVSEGEEDYLYEYTVDGKTVRGRVYSGTVEDKVNRMRVEMVYPAENEFYRQEGYGFYLRVK